MYHTHHYKVNFDKVKTLEDVIKILKVAQITFDQSSDIKEIEHLINLVPKDEDTSYVMD